MLIPFRNKKHLKEKFPRILSGLFFLLASSFAISEDLPEAMEAAGQAERWYRVELLIYQQKNVDNQIAEIWPEDVMLSYPTSWVKLKTAEEYIANPRPHPVLASWLARIQKSPFTPFVLQGDSAKTFGKAAKQIQRYEGNVLLHYVWWQPFIQNDERPAPAILIQAGKQYGDHYELEGSVAFKLSRYLHISTDLWLSEFSPPLVTGENTPAVWPALPLPPDFEARPSLPLTATEGEHAEAAEVPLSTPQSPIKQIVTIKQSRRMRSEETHYLDHPKLGILVRLTPYNDKLKP